MITTSLIRYVLLVMSIILPLSKCAGIATGVLNKLITCITCEVKRAKVYATALKLLGKTPQQIAMTLTFEYFAEHYVEDDKIYRTNLVPPYEPYLVKSFVK